MFLRIRCPCSFPAVCPAMSEFIRIVYGIVQRIQRSVVGYVVTLKRDKNIHATAAVIEISLCATKRCACGRCSRVERVLLAHNIPCIVRLHIFRSCRSIYRHDSAITAQRKQPIVIILMLLNP